MPRRITEEELNNFMKQIDVFLTATEEEKEPDCKTCVNYERRKDG